ncbi:glycosyltransferase, partial [Glycocaulis sp.]|uniref:glycosyltransferase n=1 Tax=Glycocaulis sp. TaxID=1969725 RepID=UPI003F6E87D2
MSDKVMETVHSQGERAALVCALPGSKVPAALAKAGFAVSLWSPDSGQALADIANSGAMFELIVTVAPRKGDVFFDVGGRAFARLADRMLQEDGRLALLAPGIAEEHAPRLSNRFQPVDAPVALAPLLPELYWLAPLSRWQVQDRLETTQISVESLLGRMQSAEIRARRAEMRLNEVDQLSRGLAADVVALNQAVLALSSAQDSVGRNVMVRLGGVVRTLRNRFRQTAVNPPADGAAARAALFAGAPAPEKDGAPVLVSPPYGPILPVDRARVRAFARSQISAKKLRELEEWLDRIGEGRPDYARSALYGYAAAAAGALRNIDVQRELLSKAIDIYASPSHMVEMARFLTRRGDVTEARALIERLRAREDAQGREDVLKIAQLIDKKFLWENAEAELARLGAPGESAFEPDSGKAIYFLHNALPYASAGYATRSHGICLGLIKAGIQVVPATRPGFPHDLDLGPSVPEVIPPTLEIDGVTYIYNTVFGRPEHTEPEYIHKTADEFEKLIRQVRPAVVHAASNYMTGFPALIAARRCGVPFIYEARGFWEITRASREPAFRRSSQFRGMARLEAVCAREADAAITLTSAMKDELIERGVDEGQITLVHNSVDAARFLPQARDEALAAKLGVPAGVPVIGYIGS